MTQTARHLGMTQSAVSQTISKLELALGVRLFDRAMRPLALTPSGKLLLREGAQLIASARGLARDEIRLRHALQRFVDGRLRDRNDGEDMAKALARFFSRASFFNFI